MIRRRYISIRLVQPGMIIDQSITDATGRVLVARKTKLDNYLIHALKKIGITAIYIAEGKAEPSDYADGKQISPEALEKIEKYKKKDPEKINLSESVKERVSEGMMYLFNNPLTDGFTDTAKNIAGELMDAINKNDALAVDVDSLKISDEYTFKHSVDVASMAMIIAKTQGFPDADIREIGIAGLLHDLGKSKISNDILNKPGKLTEEEFAIMKKHPVYGYQLLKDKPGMTEPILMGVLQHHEKIGGKGYPMGFTGDRVNYFARILSVADIYDALVTERPYKSGFSPRDALEMILAMTIDLDTSVIKAFMNCVILYPVGTIAKLSNGEDVKIIENVVGYPMRPKVVGLQSGKLYDLTNPVNTHLIIE